MTNASKPWTNNQRDELVSMVLEHGVEALVDLLEALVNPLEAYAYQLALVLQLLLHPHHALAQFDVEDNRRLAETLLGQPKADIVLDVLANPLKIFLGRAMRSPPLVWRQ